MLGKSSFTQKEKPPENKVPGLSIIHYNLKLLIRIKHVINIHLYVYQS